MLYEGSDRTMWGRAAMYAWMSGIFHYSELESLEQIFENVRGIIANSGGS
ncbi:MAG: hypothetical protein MGF17_04220 [Trichodesmium sp. MAG_R04]|nr:hypothetical protein [Trichodesmium sp. MAG_R04]